MCSSVSHSSFSPFKLWAGAGAGAGVLFPGLLLLINVAHLHGKLKPSRLAPESWSSTEVWDHGLVIGVINCGRKGIVHVADFRQDAYECQELTALGTWKWGKAAEDFFNFLDGYSRSGSEENPIMKFLCVQVWALRRGFIVYIKEILSTKTLTWISMSSRHSVLYRSRFWRSCIILHTKIRSIRFPGSSCFLFAHRVTTCMLCI